MTIYCNEPTQYRASDVIVNGILQGEFTAPVEVEKIFLGEVIVSFTAMAQGTGVRPDALYPYHVLTFTQGGNKTYPSITTGQIFRYVPSLSVTYPTVEGQPITVMTGSAEGLIELVSWYGDVPAMTQQYSNFKRWKLRINEAVSP